MTAHDGARGWRSCQSLSRLWFCRVNSIWEAATLSAHVADPTQLCPTQQQLASSAHSPSRSPHHRESSAISITISAMSGFASAGSIHHAIVCHEMYSSTCRHDRILSPPVDSWVMCSCSFSCTLHGSLRTHCYVSANSTPGFIPQPNCYCFLAEGDRHFCRVACIRVLSYPQTGEPRRSDERCVVAQQQSGQT